MEGFLDKLAEEILRYEQPHHFTVLFPNRRPAYFLEKKLAVKAGKPVIAPEIFAITDFFSHITGMQPAQTYDLLLLLYEAYGRVMKEKNLNIHSFDRFTGWASILLNDFDEIDKFLVPPDKLLTYLSEIKEIEEWNPGTGTAAEMNDYLTFFRLLPAIYKTFNRLLDEENLAYAGKIYRRAYESLQEWSKNFENNRILLAGFNALTLAEEKIFSYLVREKGARMFWDSDECYFKEPFEAGKFLRKYKNTPLAGKPYRWRFDACRSPKQFYTVHATDDLSQVQFAIDKLLEWEKNTPPEKEKKDAYRLKTLLVLNDPALFYPLLHALPPELEEINLTFSLPLTTSQLYRLIDSYLHFYTTLWQTGTINIYHFTSLVSHPFFPAHDKNLSPEQIFASYSVTYINKEYFFDKIKEYGFSDLFPEVQEPEEILSAVNRFLELSIHSIPADNPEAVVGAELQQLLERLIHIENKFKIFNTLDSLQKFFRRLANEMYIRFQGLPLKGYQIMGLLETRLLDFDRVLMLSMNEGIIPKGKKQKSFIPFDVRKNIAMPLYTDRNAVTAYHVYRLLSRAAEVWLVYNTTASGLSGGEPSRYIRQLREILPAHGLDMKDIYLQDALPVHTRIEELPKDESFIERLHEIFRNGVSASMITNYWHYPKQFYIDKILNWEEKDAPEDFISSNKLGYVIHEVMHELYQPYLKRPLTSQNMKEISKKAPEITRKKFYELYLGFNNIPENFTIKGRNLLALDATKEMVKRLLQIDKNEVDNHHSLVIHALESKVSFEKIVPGIGPVTFKGFIDRIDRLDGQWRVVDYKTGTAENKSIKSKNGIYPFMSLSGNSYKYLFQLYFYLWLLRETPDEKKHLKDEIIPVNYTVKLKEPVIYNKVPDEDNYFKQFEHFLFDILHDMLDTGRPFSLKKNIPQ